MLCITHDSVAGVRRSKRSASSSASQITQPEGRSTASSTSVATASLRSVGGDRPFEFHAKDGKVLRAKIVGMGVSLVVGTAARRAFEKCVLNK